MSFFSDLFTRKITFIEWMGRDATYQDILHVFGAIRVMPDEGDSFDIYRHSVIDLNSYSVINGLQQRGTEFSIKSEFAKRCIQQMSQQMNRQLKPLLKAENIEQEEEVEVEDQNENPEDLLRIFDIQTKTVEEDPFEDNCEIAVVDRDSHESDTSEAKKLPGTAIIFTKNKVGDRERFLLRLRRSGRDCSDHQMSGMPDYFRYVLHLKQSNRIVATYRKEGAFGTGGMAFFVLDANSGELLHNDYIK